MPQSKVDEIVANSFVVNTDVMSLEEYAALNSQEGEDVKDEWEGAIDGMLMETVNRFDFHRLRFISKRSFPCICRHFERFQKRSNGNENF